MAPARFSIRWQADGRDAEFGTAHSLLEAGRICLRAPKDDERCMVVWDSHENAYVEPVEMAKVYRKLMR